MELLPSNLFLAEYFVKDRSDNVSLSGEIKPMDFSDCRMCITYCINSCHNNECIRECYSKNCDYPCGS
jgi:hypothetical protein